MIPSLHRSTNPFSITGTPSSAVVHGSQPKFSIPEITQDIQHATRFIRFNAAKYHVDPDHLGISGASAGGHLSLTMAVKGAKGDAHPPKIPWTAKAARSNVCACFFPPTDFLNYSKPGEEALGIGALQQFKIAFGPRANDAEDRLNSSAKSPPSISSIPTCRPFSSSMATRTLSFPSTRLKPF